MEGIPFRVLIEQFHVGMKNFLLVAKPPHLSRKDQPIPFFEAGLEIPFMAVKPLERHHAAAVSDHGFKDSSPAVSIEHEAGKKDFPETGLLLTCLQLRDPLQVSPIFIAPGQKVKGIPHRPNPLSLEKLGELGPTPLTYCIGIESGSLRFSPLSNFISPVSSVNRHIADYLDKHLLTRWTLDLVLPRS